MTVVTEAQVEEQTLWRVLCRNPALAASGSAGYFGGVAGRGVVRRFLHRLCHDLWRCRRCRWGRDERQFNLELFGRAFRIRYSVVAGRFNCFTLVHGDASLIDIHQSVVTFGYQLVTDRQRQPPCEASSRL